MPLVYLSNIVDPKKGISDEQSLHSPKLMCSLDMPWAIEGPGRVPSHHVIECLQSLSLLCSLGVLQSLQCHFAAEQHAKCYIVPDQYSHLGRGAKHS